MDHWPRDIGPLRARTSIRVNIPKCAGCQMEEVKTGPRLRMFQHCPKCRLILYCSDACKQDQLLAYEGACPVYRAEKEHNEVTIDSDIDMEDMESDNFNPPSPIDGDTTDDESVVSSDVGEDSRAFGENPSEQSSHYEDNTNSDADDEESTGEQPNSFLGTSSVEEDPTDGASSRGQNSEVELPDVVMSHGNHQHTEFAKEPVANQFYDNESEDADDEDDSSTDISRGDSFLLSDNICGKNEGVRIDESFSMKDTSSISEESVCNLVSMLNMDEIPPAEPRSEILSAYLGSLQNMESLTPTPQRSKELSSRAIGMQNMERSPLTTQHSEEPPFTSMKNLEEPAPTEHSEDLLSIFINMDDVETSTPITQHTKAPPSIIMQNMERSSRTAQRSDEPKPIAAQNTEECAPTTQPTNEPSSSAVNNCQIVENQTKSNSGTIANDRCPVNQVLDNILDGTGNLERDFLTRFPLGEKFMVFRILIDCYRIHAEDELLRGYPIFDHRVGFENMLQKAEVVIYHESHKTLLPHWWDREEHILCLYHALDHRYYPNVWLKADEAFIFEDHGDVLMPAKLRLLRDEIFGHVA